MAISLFGFFADSGTYGSSIDVSLTGLQETDSLLVLVALFTNPDPNNTTDISQVVLDPSGTPAYLTKKFGIKPTDQRFYHRHAAYIYTLNKCTGYTGSKTLRVILTGALGGEIEVSVYRVSGTHPTTPFSDGSSVAKGIGWDDPTPGTGGIPSSSDLSVDIVVTNDAVNPNAGAGANVLRQETLLGNAVVHWGISTRVSGTHDWNFSGTSTWTHGRVGIVGGVTIPTSPSNCTANQVGNKILVEWDDLANNEESYKIERKRDAEGYVEVAVLAANTTSWSDPNIDAGSTYTYRVRASNSAGDSSHCQTNPVSILGGVVSVGKSDLIWSTFAPVWTTSSSVLIGPIPFTLLVYTTTTPSVDTGPVNITVPIASGIIWLTKPPLLSALTSSIDSRWMTVTEN